MLHNYLAVNKNLYKWKLIDSPRCNYCKTDIESIKHLFCECHVTRTFYLNVKEWCKNFNVNLPEMNATDVLYGVSPDNIENALINTLLLIYKQIVYQCRDNKTNMTLTFYKLKVKQLEAIEHEINNDKNKKVKHKKKWFKYVEFIHQK